MNIFATTLLKYICLEIRKLHQSYTSWVLNLDIGLEKELSGESCTAVVLMYDR